MFQNSMLLPLSCKGVAGQIPISLTEKADLDSYISFGVYLGLSTNTNAPIWRSGVSTNFHMLVIGISATACTQIAFPRGEYKPCYRTKAGYIWMAWRYFDNSLV